MLLALAGVRPNWLTIRRWRGMLPDECRRRVLVLPPPTSWSEGLAHGFRRIPCRPGHRNPGGRLPPALLPHSGAVEWTFIPPAREPRAGLRAVRLRLAG